MQVKKSKWILLGASIFLAITVSHAKLGGIVVQPSTEVVTESTPTKMLGDAYGGLFAFDISQLTDPQTSVEVQVWLSNDNGTTWDFGGSGVFQGGSHLDLNGNPITIARFGSWITTPTYDVNNKFIGDTPKWKDPLISSH